MSQESEKQGEIPKRPGIAHTNFAIHFARKIASASLFFLIRMNGTVSTSMSSKNAVWSILYLVRGK